MFPDFKYGWLAEEFNTRLPREIDFNIEANNANRCRSIFKNDKRVAVPKVYDELTRYRVLVMSFEKGIPVTHVKQLAQEGIDLKELSRLISEVFIRMIFKEGFIHADPHPGNLFVRKAKDGNIELVILDHGIYTVLDNETRLSYNKLWRGILTQDELAMREASSELGTDFYHLFASMVVNRKFDDIMDKDKTNNLKTRLGDRDGKEFQQEMQEYAVFYHKDIVEILDMIKRELLLVLKTNNYLRAIDKRLGNPNNTYNTINEMTWQVYSVEFRKKMGLW